MKIASAELYDLTLPLKEPFAISGGVMRERRSLVVVWRASIPGRASAVKPKR